MAQIFIVEDNELVAQYLQKSLSNEVDTQTFSSAEPCYDKLQAGVLPDYLLIDHFLPGAMNGLELYKKASKLMDNERLIILTENAGVDFFEEMADNDVEHYVQKFGDYVNKIRQIIKETTA